MKQRQKVEDRSTPTGIEPMKHVAIPMMMQRWNLCNRQNPRFTADNHAPSSPPSIEIKFKAAAAAAAVAKLCGKQTKRGGLTSRR